MFNDNDDDDDRPDIGTTAAAGTTIAGGNAKGTTTATGTYTEEEETTTGANRYERRDSTGGSGSGGNSSAVNPIAAIPKTTASSAGVDPVSPVDTSLPTPPEGQMLLASEWIGAAGDGDANKSSSSAVGKAQTVCSAQQTTVWAAVLAIMLSFGTLVADLCAIRGPDHELKSCARGVCPMLRSLALALCWLVVVASWGYVHVALQHDRNARRDAWMVTAGGYTNDSDDDAADAIGSLRFRPGHGMSVGIVALITSVALFCFNFQAYRTGDYTPRHSHTKLHQADMEERMLDVDSDDEGSASKRTVVEFDLSSPVHSPARRGVDVADNAASRDAGGDGGLMSGYEKFE